MATNTLTVANMPNGINLPNEPTYVLRIDETMREFLLNNCRSNLSLGLTVLNQIEDKTTAIKMVQMIEDFKRLQKLVEAASQE